MPRTTDRTTVTEWMCERCKNGGSVAHSEHADVYTVRNRIEEQHYDRDPACAMRNGLSFVRVASAAT
jgi:hypothetical protein